jgi:hypothetical protein
MVFRWWQPAGVGILAVLVLLSTGDLGDCSWCWYLLVSIFIKGISL